MPPVVRFTSRLGRPSVGIIVVVVALLPLIPTIIAAPGSAPEQDRPAPVTPEQMERGSQVYHQICFACHQINGQGISGTYPPLAKSDVLLHQRDRVVDIILRGVQGPIEVNGETFDQTMPVLNLTDRQIADVMTYVLNSWGNKGGAVTTGEVANERKKLAEASASKRPSSPAAENNGPHGTAA